MQGVNIICLGRLKEIYLRDACKEYEKRLGGSCVLKIYELEPVALPNEPSDRQIEDALEKEAEMIEKKLAKNALTVAMCIEGKQLSSEDIPKRYEITHGYPRHFDNSLSRYVWARACATWLKDGKF